MIDVLRVICVAPCSLKSGSGHYRDRALRKIEHEISLASFDFKSTRLLSGKSCKPMTQAQYCCK
jgi:hypothetical protein